MAKFNDKMRGSITASLTAGPAPAGSAGAIRPPGSPAPASRQFDVRRRLDSAALVELDSVVGDADQPRTEFDDAEIEALAESIKARGQLQPIRVRWIEAIGKFRVIVGERRYRAAIKASLRSIACIVVADEATAEDILEDQLVENALRVDLQPIEQAKAYRRLISARGLTQRQLAERLHVGHASIARALALLELPETIQAKVESGAIAPNTAYELSKVGDPGEQAQLAGEAEAGRLRRDDLKERTRSPRASKPAADRRILRLEAGGEVVVSHPDGLDGGRLVAMLREALAQAEAPR